MQPEVARRAARIAALWVAHGCVLVDANQAATLDAQRWTGRITGASDPLSTGDPLQAWLYGLTVDVGDVEASKFGVEFQATGLVCTELSLGRLKSELLAPAASESGLAAAGPKIQFNMEGLGMKCSAAWSIHTGPIPTGSGELVAQLAPSATAIATLAFPLDAQAVPQRSELIGCDVSSFDFNIDMGSSISGEVLSWLIWELSGTIQREVKSQACATLTELAATNLTRAVLALNRGMLPPTPSEALLARSLAGVPEPPAVPGSVDWTRLELLKALNWILRDMIGLQGIDDAMEWALDGTGHVNVSGSKEALATFSLAAGISRLNISVGLQHVALDGLYGVQNVTPIVAADPGSLEGGVGFGVGSHPALSATSALWVHLASEGPGSPSGGVQRLYGARPGEPIAKGPPAAIDEFLALSLGLGEPSLFGRIKLLVDQDDVTEKRTLAQWVYGPGGCARDTLLAAPELQALDLTFVNVTTPLSCQSKTQGILEADLAALFNHLVTLFNSLYLPYLPAAVNRFAASDAFRDFANKHLAELAKPTPAGETACIDADEAASKAATLPRQADWRSILNGTVRKAVDNVADGFFRHNVTTLDAQALERLPPVHLRTDATVIELHLTGARMEGMSKVAKLRLLEPNATDPEALGNVFAVRCPTEQEPWQPTLTMSGTVKTTSSSRRAVKTKLSVPCGALVDELRVSFDIHKALGMPVPPDVFCALAAFSEIAVVDNAWETKGAFQLVVELEGRAPVDVVASLCGEYPRLCYTVSDSIHGARRYVNPAIGSALQKAQGRCTQHAAGPEASAGAEAAAGASSAALWCTGVALTVALTLVISSPVIYFHGWAQQRSDEGRACPMAFDSCYDGSKRSFGFMVLTSALLAAALVLRTVTVWFCNVARSDAYVYMDDFGEVVDVNLITFTFFGIVTHYWEAKAYLSSVLLFVNSFLVAYAVMLLPLLLWLTPVLANKRRQLLRAAFFASRLPFIDVVFFGVLIPVLNSDLPFPLGINAQLRCSPDIGIYMGITSSLCAIAALQCFLSGSGLEPTQPASVRRASLSDIAISGLPQESLWRRAFKVAMPIMFVLGLVVWFCTEFFAVRFTGVAGDVMEPRSFSPSKIFSAVWSSSPFMGTMLLIVVILAPFLQALAAGLAVVGNPPPAMLLREIGNTFAALDVFFAGLFALTLEINDVATWIVSNKFGDLCDMQEKVSGHACIGITPSILLVGMSALFLSVVSSCGFAASCAVVDALRAKPWRPTASGDLRVQPV